MSKTRQKFGLVPLIHLSDWEDYEVDKGRFKGRKGKQRYVVCADKYNWILALEKIVGGDAYFDPGWRKYFPSFRLLIKYWDKDMGFDGETAVLRIARKIASLLGEEFEEISGETAADMGRCIDVNFQVNMNLDDNVYKRVFAEDPETEE